MFGHQAGRGYCPFLNQSLRRAGKLVPPTWLTLFDPPWRSPETLPTQFTGPLKLLFHMNGWSWLTFHNSLNPLKKQQLAPVSPRPSTSSGQHRFTAWLHLGISQPSTSSSHLRLLYSLGKVPWAKHWWGLNLAGTTQETPGPAHPVDSYRPHRITTLPLHS